MKRALFIICIILFSGLLFSQEFGEIRGRVYDRETNNPLAGVSVIIVGTTLGSATDVNGSYIIKNVKPGIYKVQAVFVGYNSQVRNVIIRPNETVMLDFYLVPTVVQQEDLAQEIEALKEEIRQLREEINRLRLGRATQRVEFKSYFGLGPAASKVYYTPNDFSIAGYGEITHEEYLGYKRNILRFIPYIGYKFGKNIVINLGIGIAHEGEFDYINPKIYAEFLYLDFILSDKFNLRTGLILLPVSRMNEYHELPVFFGTLRPDIERFIIQTAWREIGIMVYGKLSSSLSYKISLTNGLRFNNENKIILPEGSRFAEAGRVDFEVYKGLTLSGSVYYGSQGYERNQIIFVAEGLYQFKNLFVKGLFCQKNVKGDYDDYYYYDYNNFSRITKALGWYAEVGYNLAPLINPKSSTSFSPFIRFEKYRLSGYGYYYNYYYGYYWYWRYSWEYNESVLTIGLDFKFNPRVVIKTDYQVGEQKSKRFNLGIGFILL